MLNFYQLYEVLSSHGGIKFSPKSNSEEESIKNILPRENLDDNKEIASKSVRFESLYFNPSDEKYISKMYAANNTKGIINGLDKMLSKVDDFDFHIFMGKPFFYGTYKDGRIITKKSSKLMQTPLSVDENYGLALENTTKMVDGISLVGHTGSAYGLFSAMFFI